MLFRIAEMAGEPDWEGLGRAIPEHVLDGWCERYEMAPFGSDHLYDFLARAFVTLGWAVHDPAFAAKLTKEDFKWWEKPRESVSVGMNDDEILATMLRWDALKRDGTV